MHGHLWELVFQEQALAHPGILGKNITERILDDLLVYRLLPLGIVKCGQRVDTPLNELVLYLITDH
jgi:hypothetical protein